MLSEPSPGRDKRRPEGTVKLPVTWSGRRRFVGNTPITPSHTRGLHRGGFAQQTRWEKASRNMAVEKTERRNDQVLLSHRSRKDHVRTLCNFQSGAEMSRARLV